LSASCREQFPEPQFKGRQGFAKPPSGNFLSEEIEKILADLDAHLIRLGSLEGFSGISEKTIALIFPESTGK
jgi:hypothetical protein